MLNNTKNRDPVQLSRARQGRKEMSASERVLWNLVRRDRLGFRFKRQVPVLDYILDFYCAEAWLCIEVDGEQHLLNAHYDSERDHKLEAKGIETLRIPLLWLYDASYMVKVETAIKSALWRRSGRKPLDR